MFSKEFTATSSSPLSPTKSDHELTKTLSDMTEKFSVSSSTDAEAQEIRQMRHIEQLFPLLTLLY